MSWITDILGRIFPRREAQQEGGNYPVLGLTGKPLNPLYQPKPKRDDFDECEKIMDKFMRGLGYRKYLTAEGGLPRPRRRGTKKSKQMEPGEFKTMARITKFKK